MYNDTIKAENKIITHDNLTQIFQAMGETLKKYQKISIAEEQRNHMLDYNYQSYTFKDEGSKMKVIIDFYDNTNITFDNYDNFASIFYSRIEEIRSLDVYYTLNYYVITPEPNRSRTYYSQSIQMHITENKLDITLKLDSQDNKLEEIYNLIKNIVLNAPEKYDTIIKKKNKITNTVTFAIGMIPALIITTILLFIPVIGSIILNGYVVYPIGCVILAFIIGSLVASTKLDKYYDTIVPEKKYDGYSDGKAVYKDDIDKFISTSEILIGKKVDNLENRNAIQKEYEKYKRLIPKELIILLVATIIVIIVGLFV